MNSGRDRYGHRGQHGGDQVEVLVGTSSDDLVKPGSVMVVTDPAGRPPETVFDGTVEVRTF